MTVRLKDKYLREAAPKLKEEFGYKTPSQIPVVTKVVINSGMGRAVSDSKVLDFTVKALAQVSGQNPVQTVAKKSIAGFKLREKQKIGVMVTLRGDRMYEFLDRLVAVALPRIRDFRGLPEQAFDPQGNYSLGISDHTIFPEVSFEEATQSIGLQINIVTSAKSQAEGRRLLELLGFPLRRADG